LRPLTGRGARGQVSLQRQTALDDCPRAIHVQNARDGNAGDQQDKQK
jgi:hypothetical protein